jgi:hypothetical protein
VAVSDRFTGGLASFLCGWLRFGGACRTRVPGRGIVAGVRWRDDPGVDAAVAEAAACVKVAGALIPQADSAGSVGRPPRGSTSTVPGNTAALYAYLSLAELARRLECSLLNQVRGVRTRPRRGGSEGNTLAALRWIGVLAGQLEYGDACRVARLLDKESAGTETLRAVDTRARWLPIRPCGCHDYPKCGHRPPICPYCKNPSLRRAEYAYVIMCQGWRWTPDEGSVPCADSDGNRPRAHLDYSKVTGEAVLVFGDGLVLGPVAA